MNLSRKRIKHLLLHKNKNQSKKKYIKKNKKRNKNTFRKRKKKNLRTGSVKYFKKRKVSKYKRKSYLKGGGGKEDYLNTFLTVLTNKTKTGDPSLEDNRYYNFDFIFNKNSNKQSILSPEILQEEFNTAAKTEEEKKEDEEAQELKEIEEKEDAERKSRGEFIDEESEKFIENSKKADNSVIYVYNGEAGPAVSVQHSENQIDNWFKSISNVLSTI